MKRFLAVVLCLMWMGFIFYNSSNTGKVSNAKSYEIGAYLKKQYSLLKKSLKLLVKDETVKVNNTVEGDVETKNNVSSSSKANKEEDSNVSSNSISDKEEKVLVKGSNKQLVNSKDSKINIIIRKNAHAFEYLILSLLIANLLFSFNFKGKKAIIYILFICLFYAVTDEFHQVFVVGRTSSVVDILIDFIGSIVGIIIFYSIYYGYFKYKSRF